MHPLRVEGLDGLGILTLFDEGNHPIPNKVRGWWVDVALRLRLCFIRLLKEGLPLVVPGHCEKASQMWDGSKRLHLFLPASLRKAETKLRQSSKAKPSNLRFLMLHNIGEGSTQHVSPEKSYSARDSFDGENTCCKDPLPGQSAGQLHWCVQGMRILNCRCG